ncbi:sigma-70 family RNA polymerase sigma factor [Peribacillus muralis]|uniref:sigma-70 family RNA polymerase sigma factor n=1 Tax=Peribacillus muralis TaxID=264697 RepID=UPI003D081D89
MKMYLATDTQLEEITKHDHDCPPSPLGEVVEEMLNRNLFDRMITHCCKMVFGSFNRMKELHSMELEDFLQIGRTAVFKAVKMFEPGKGKSFSSFVHMFIKQRIVECIKFLERERRDQRNEFRDIETEEGLNILDLMPSRTNVEKFVINKIMIEDFLNQLTERQRQVMELYLKDHNFEEIAEILGRKGKGRSLNKTYNDAMKKLRKGA